MEFVSSVCWIKQGAAMNLPHKVKMRTEELKQILGKPDEEDDVENEEIEGDEEIDIDKKYNMDDYDDEEIDVVGAQLAGLACYSSSKDDPHLKEDEESSDSEDEKEAFQIKDNDNLLVVGRVDDDCATMEVHVYNHADNDLYVHHDIFLPAYPLCMEWLNFDPSSNDGTTGNFVAIGDMTPIISIWNIDIVDCLDPTMKLGKKEQKKKKNKPKVKAVGHKDAVISLHWNRLERNILASGSADTTAILWDLNTAQPTVTLADHTDRIQVVRYHPFESQSLLTGSADSFVKLWDAKSHSVCRTWNAGGAVEHLTWDHFSPFNFYVATANGQVLAYDVRNEGSCLSTLAGHDTSITSVVLSNHCPSMMVTAAGSMLKVWDIENVAEPKFVLEYSPEIGEILTTEASTDQPFVFAVGGDEMDGNLKIVNLAKEFPKQMEAFSGRKLMKVVDTVENKKTSAEHKVHDNHDDDEEMESDDDD